MSQMYFAQIAEILRNRIDSSLLPIVAIGCAFGLLALIWMLVSRRMRSKTRMVERLREERPDSRRSLVAAAEAQRSKTTDTVLELHKQVEKQDPNKIQARLYRAGFYGPAAMKWYYAIRIALCGLAFIIAFVAGRRYLPGLPLQMLFGVSFILACTFLIIPNLVLDRLGKGQLEQCRRAFPGFMDMMVVCADAGMSLEASIERVSSEMAITSRALGTYLKLMTLEIRAGRPMREALRNLADRLEMEEAKTLAILFKQSEELGTSLTQTLRVYSAEMRERRIMLAEEKANALPIKMMLPLGLCVFPIVMVVIMLPVIVRMKGFFF